MTKRWKQRPDGSTWGDWGDDDELGRINLLTPEKVLQGVREVEAGISFCLSLPLDFPGGTALNQRRHPPSLAPTEDMDGNPDTFYNVHMSEMPRRRRPQVRRRVGRRRRDALAAVLDAVGLARPRRGRVRRRRRRRRGGRLLQRLPRRRRPRRAEAPTPRATAAATVCFAHHLGLEHMAFHGRAGPRRPRRPRPPPRPRLARRRPRDARGDHGGRRRRRRARRHAPAPHRLRDQGPRVEPRPGSRGDPHDVHVPRRARRRRCSSGSPTRRSRRSSPTTTRSKGCSARTATRAGTRSCRSTTSASSSSASRSGRCGTCTSSRPGCASTTAAASCSPRRRCGCPAAVGSPLTPVATV